MNQREADTDAVNVLVVRARDGDLEAYGELVRRFQDMAYGYACAILGDVHLAEDVTQESFLAAYRGLRTLTDPCAFAGWFRRIVVTRCATAARRDRRTRPLDTAAETRSREPTPPELAERAEMCGRVLAAIRALLEHQRVAVTLFYINGYSQREVAEFLDVPVTTVQKRLHDARERLKERMWTMVKDSLRESLPSRDDASDRVRLLLEMGELMSQGIPLIRIAEQLRTRTWANRVQTAIERLVDDLLAGKSVSTSFAAHEGLFPTMVIWFIDTGEKLGVLDVTMPMAGRYLSGGGTRSIPTLLPTPLTFSSARQSNAQWTRAAARSFWTAAAPRLCRTTRTGACSHGLSWSPPTARASSSNAWAWRPVSARSRPV